MKKLFFLILALPCFASASRVVHFDCVSKENLDVDQPVKIRFDMKYNDQGKFEYIYNGEREDLLFKVEPEHSAMAELNENEAIREDNDKYVTFWGDGDGFVLVTLTLFKNTEYRYGYARVVDGGYGLGNHYSVVSCKNDFYLKN